MAGKEFDIDNQTVAGKEYMSILGLEDQVGLTNTYYLFVRVIDTSPTPFTLDADLLQDEDPWIRNEKFKGEIVELTETGLMTIEFTMPLFPVMNMSWVNQTSFNPDGQIEFNGTADIYVLPANGRQYE